MNKKRILVLILFACLIITSMFIGNVALLSRGRSPDNGMEQTDTNAEDASDDEAAEGYGEYVTEIVEGDTLTGAPIKIPDKEVLTEEQIDSLSDSNHSDLVQGDTDKTDQTTEEGTNQENQSELETKEPWLSANPTDTGKETGKESITGTTEPTLPPVSEEVETDTALASSSNSLQLIYDCTTIDYMSYVPEMVTDDELAMALDIANPDLSLEAEAAILFDADTKKVLYYKNPVQAVFPASTSKLLTAMLALDWCSETEEVTVGDEITMIAIDSSRAYLHEGEVLTIRNLLEAMLLPSGNDAAYVVAVYVGRKALDNPNAANEDAVLEFIRLMNNKAKVLGAKNSCFKTPDGYDAIGQYTTAYDMGLIGMAAIGYDTITEISKKSSSRNIFVSGEDVTWDNTNRLVNKSCAQYYSNAIGLKTGSSTMAGKCLISAGKKDGKRVVSVVMNSSSSGRWDDSIKLLKYGLK